MVEGVVRHFDFHVETDKDLASDVLERFKEYKEHLINSKKFDLIRSVYSTNINLFFKFGPDLVSGMETDVKDLQRWFESLGGTLIGFYIYEEAGNIYRCDMYRSGSFIVASVDWLLLFSAVNSNAIHYDALMRKNNPDYDTPPHDECSFCGECAVATTYDERYPSLLIKACLKCGHIEKEGPSYVN